MWFFSSSNPTIAFGGFHGEGKKEMYDQLPAHLVPRTIYIMHNLSFAEVRKKVADAGFKYPFVVKPDVGMKGILFRKIDNEEQLEKYHEKIPVEYIVQDLIEYPVEVSVFYYRHPAESILALLQCRGWEMKWKINVPYPDRSFRHQDVFFQVEW